MRFLVKVTMPVEAGNASAEGGFSAIPKILEQQKPEAAYFIAEGGKRTALLFLNMDDPSELPKIAEPWFLAMNAGIEVTPAMTPEDLQKAAPDVANAVKQFGLERVRLCLAGAFCLDRDTALGAYSVRR